MFLAIRQGHSPDFVLYSNNGDQKLNCWFNACCQGLSALIRELRLPAASDNYPFPGDSVEHFISYHAQPGRNGIEDPETFIRDVMVNYLKKDREELKKHQPVELLLDATLEDICDDEDKSRPGMEYFSFMHPSIQIREEQPTCCATTRPKEGERRTLPPPSKVAYITMEIPVNPRGGFYMADAITSTFSSGVPSAIVPCPRCGRRLRRKEILDLVEPSKGLVINLNRIISDSTGQTRTKINTPVLEADGLTIPLPGSGQVVNYTLVAAVEHTNSVRSGHFKAYVRARSKWWELNDDLPIQEAPEEVVDKCSLFFYKKADFQFPVVDGRSVVRW